jgi:hypothetical protein
MPMSLPVEISLMIIGEILKPKDGLHSSNDDTDTDSDRPLYRASRKQRLASFRDIACISKAWVDPARTAFWKEINLFNVRELVAFAHAIDKPFAKPSCIRNIYFLLPDTIFHWEPFPNHLTEQTLRYFPVVLRYLPAHLDVLHVDCPYHYKSPNGALYKCMQAARQDHTWVIEVSKLIIGPRPPYYDIFSHFAFARNVVHLVLNVSQYDREANFSSPLNSMQLESFFLRIKFASPRWWNYPLAPVTKAVSRALRPACMELRSFALNLVNLTEGDQTAYTVTKTVEYVLSLCGPSTSSLDLRAIDASSNISKELAEAGAVVRCPALLCLRLNQFGVDPDFIRQLVCSELRRLEVTVMDTRQDEAVASVARYGRQTLANLLATLELPELAGLEQLEINFGCKEWVLYESHLGPWTSRKEIWVPLERACAARNITYFIRHAE